MIQCPKCKTENYPDSIYCKNCGMKLTINKQNKSQIYINLDLVKGLLSLFGGCVLLFLIYRYLNFFWDLMNIFVEMSPSLNISQFHAPFFHFTLKLIFFGGICTMLIWQCYNLSKRMEKEKVLWRTGLSLISVSFLILGISMIIILIWNLGVQHDIVEQARERLLTTDASDPSYYFYQYYSNFRKTTIAGTLFYGGCAIGIIISGFSVLKKVL